MNNIQKHYPYIGKTPFIACQFDQRFSYCLYVPEEYYVNADEQYRLMVIIHGSGRTAEKYRDLFAEFAEHNKCIILAPLFPIGIEDSAEQHNYKYIRYKNIRYDHVLNAMIDEVRKHLKRLKKKILMHGYSGGGQFAHRYFYLYPENLHAVSIGAPGTVTLLNNNLNWWPGTKNIKEQFGLDVTPCELAKVKVQLIIGADDNEEWDVIVQKGSSTWAEGANDSGNNRLQRMVSLKNNLREHGITVEHKIIPNVEHKGFEILDDVKSFFQKNLTL